MRSYRLYPSQINTLKKITADLNAISQKHINEADVIKGLIALGGKTQPEKILKAISEAWGL